MPVHYYTAIVVVNALWLGWCGVWAVTALRAKKTVYRQPVSQRLIFLMLAMGALGGMQTARRWAVPALPISPLTEVAGIALCAAGLGWSVWARLVLGSNWSGFVTLKEDHELIQSGPYRITRHPIYSGLLVGIAGTMLALVPSLIGVGSLVLVGLAFLIKLQQEEQLMMRQFPEAYGAYRERVRARLIPFVW